MTDLVDLLDSAAGRSVAPTSQTVDRDLRRTAAFVRQGEWFFIPRKNFTVDEKDVLRNEPIRRGAGKPHVCENLFRTGGETVYVNARYPNGLTLGQWHALPKKERKHRNWPIDELAP